MVAASESRTSPILAIGSALVVPIVPAPATSDGRTSAATAALIRATGRRDIVVTRRPSGRPRLEPPYPELGVSLSHRDGLLLAAYSPDGPVGTDVEPDAPDLDAVRLAADHFAPGEARAVAAADGPGRRDLFLRLWVAKEAALKITGRGIHDGAEEPDLSGVLTALSRDETAIALPATRRLPALILAVRRLSLPGLVPVYCALAVSI